MSYLIIQWPHGYRRILDYVVSERTAPSYETMDRYRSIFGDSVEWVAEDQREWLRQEGFLP